MDSLVVGQDNRTPPVGTSYDGFGEPLLIRYREFHMVQRPQSPGCDYPRTPPIVETLAIRQPKQDQSLETLPLNAGESG
jgi:hypothetical protein